MTRFPWITNDVQQFGADEGFDLHVKGIQPDLSEATEDYLIGYAVGVARGEEWLVQQVRFGDGAYRR